MAKYQLAKNTGTDVDRTDGIWKDDSTWVPNDERNRDWKDYQAWLAEGNEPLPSE